LPVEKKSNLGGKCSFPVRESTATEWRKTEEEEEQVRPKEIKESKSKHRRKFAFTRDNANRMENRQHRFAYYRESSRKMGLIKRKPF